jgi:hypothetical protein
MVDGQFIAVLGWCGRHRQVLPITFSGANGLHLGSRIFAISVSFNFANALADSPIPVQLLQSLPTRAL